MKGWITWFTYRAQGKFFIRVPRRYSTTQHHAETSFWPKISVATSFSILLSFCKFYFSISKPFCVNLTIQLIYYMCVESHSCTSGEILTPNFLPGYTEYSSVLWHFFSCLSQRELHHWFCCPKTSHTDGNAILHGMQQHMLGKAGQIVLPTHIKEQSGTIVCLFALIQSLLSALSRESAGQRSQRSVRTH